jgi:hypothetical protein
MPEPEPTPYFNERKEPQSRNQWIRDLLLKTYWAMDKPIPDDPVLVMMVKDVSELTDEQLGRGLTRLRKEREWVTVKAILELSGAAEEDGRPGVEVAWAMCPKTEEQSVVWTDEMAQAFGLARKLLGDGDEIGARMTFKEQYSSLVSAARAARIPVRWTPCLGWDVNGRVAPLSEAVEKKRISAEHAFRLLGLEGRAELLRTLPAPERKLLTGSVSDDAAVELAAIRRRFGNRPTVERDSSDLPSDMVIHDLAKDMPEMAAPAPRRIEQSDEERKEHARRVREQAARFKEHAAKRGSAAQPIPLTEAAPEPETDAERETIQ